MRIPRIRKWLHTLPILLFNCHLMDQVIAYSRILNNSSSIIYVTKENRTIIDVAKIFSYQRILTTRSQMAVFVFFFLFLIIPLTSIIFLIGVFRCCVWCYQKHISRERMYHEPRLEDIEKMEQFLVQCLRQEQEQLATQLAIAKEKKLLEKELRLQARQEQDAKEARETREAALRDLNHNLNHNNRSPPYDELYFD